MSLFTNFLNKVTNKPPAMLNLGCGDRIHPAWVNVDFLAHSPGIIQHDLRKPLPFADESCKVVYHSHVLEHFPKVEAPLFLKECWRVLQPNGILRVVIPDLETIVRLYLQNLEDALKGDAGAIRRYEWLMLEMLDQMAREQSGGEMLKYWQQNPMPAEDFVYERVGHEARKFVETYRASPARKPSRQSAAAPADPLTLGRFRLSGENHKWMYDRFSLGTLLRDVGFQEAAVCRADESRIPDFASYGLDVMEDDSTRKPDSLFMEAVKK